MGFFVVALGKLNVVKWSVPDKDVQCGRSRTEPWLSYRISLLPLLKLSLEKV